MAFEPKLTDRVIGRGSNCVSRGAPERQFTGAEYLRVGGENLFDQRGSRTWKPDDEDGRCIAVAGT